MKLRLLLSVWLFTLELAAFGGDAQRYSAMPILTTPEVSTQLLAKSAQQWAKHADVVAGQIGKIPDFLGRAMYVPTQATGAMFLETYGSLLSASLTKNGLSVSSDPKSPLVIEIVTHLLPRSGGTREYVGREPLEKARRMEVKAGPAAVEMVVVTTIRDRSAPGNVAVYANTDIFYVDPAEYRQFVGDVQAVSLKTRKVDSK